MWCSIANSRSGLFDCVTSIAIFFAFAVLCMLLLLHCRCRYSIVYVIAVAMPLPLQYCVCCYCCHALTVAVLCMLLLLPCHYRCSIVYAVQDQELHKQLLSSGAVLVHFVPVWVTRRVSAAPRCSYCMCLLAAESSSTAGLLLLTLYHYAMILVTLCSIVWK